ncbi:MAG TPA: hypothetical protein VGA75_01075 [Paracoccaceae bacterium]
MVEGASFTAEAYLNGDGIIELKVTMLEGSADFNSLFWGDEEQLGDSFSFETESWNIDAVHCQEIQWDGGYHLSNPEADPDPAKGTYLEAGEVGIVTLPGVASLDDLDILGVHATNASTPDGEINAVVGTGIDPDADCDKEDEDLFPEWGQDISNAVFYYDTDGDGISDYSVKIDEFSEDADDDLDTRLGDMRSFIEDDNESLQGATLLGVSIKGGKLESQYYQVEGDSNGTEPDPDLAPDNLLNTGKGNDDVLFYRDFVEAFGEVAEEDADALEEEEELVV